MLCRAAYIFDTQDDLKITREIEEFERLLENQKTVTILFFDIPNNK